MALVVVIIDHIDNCRKPEEEKKNFVILQTNDIDTMVCLKHDNICITIFNLLINLPVAMIVSYKKFCLLYRHVWFHRTKERISLEITQSL